MRRLPLAAAIYLAMGSMALAQEAPVPADDGSQETPVATSANSQEQKAVTLGTVTVTAQKREENLQEVPISIQAIGQAQLEQQNVADFDDYAKLIPSLSYGTAGGGVFSGPGFLQVYMRGVASGGDGNHSGSRPSVGVYLDEQPITTITGALDVHMYDIARVEALAGPQGTLYGASSQAGTLRIITNKPDASRFAASVSGEVNVVDGGGIGHVLEGMVNLPVNDRTALRLVGWQKHDAGYVDNVRSTITFPTSGIVADNTRFVEDDYNEADTVGARAALQIDLDDNWTITPTIMGQHQDAHGSTGYDPSVGEFKVMHGYPEFSKDKWYQAALTVQGKVGNFDLTYTYAHLKRDVDSAADYTDYGFWYDTLSGYGAYMCTDFDPVSFTCDPATYINPSQHIFATDGYRTDSHELRLASPADNRLRVVGGLFWQRQSHDILQNYQVDGLSAVQEVPGWADTIWLTAQQRVDRDKAVFGEVSFDITPRLTATAGMRWFRADNSLYGFFGYGDWGWSSSSGVVVCTIDQQFHGAPCVNLDKRVKESDSIGRFNLSWKIDDNKMVYATWSEGYRPGGINRRGTVPPYTSDFLTNYEAGWKTAWLDNRIIFNGAVFREDWKDFQFSYLGLNGLTEIRNANKARIEGAELELQWQASYNFLLSGGFAWYDAKLMEDYCGFNGTDGNPVSVCPPGTINPATDEPVDGPEAAKGTRLPITARFKGNLTGRYSWDIGDNEAYVQGALFHQGSRRADLRDAENALLGDLDAYTLFDLSGGIAHGDWKFDLFVKNVFNKRTELTKFAECATLTCGYQPYIVSTPPRTIGLRVSREF
ncbi:TonB-dependent receptor [Cognatiluteimonas weifangensis]|uniref:TonB-dependent receptor n=1 Tax=Cognatiluteimonas weifangensis TaxID=2303539 RepID=A0A372DLK6_9GAMM|nr:TonB-dependent receptor [Luteimonas weifangensis]RFP60384.1 TonB-dependent receptor [Luteimonas weifangensis]